MSLGPFNPEQMHLVAAIADEGSFSRAAAALGVTQSAVSQQVRRLEDGLGRRLFRRNPAGLALTPDGEAYLVYARAMMRVGEEARRHFEQAPAAGAIRLGLTEDLARTVLPAVLAMFSRDHPDFSFTVDCGASVDLFGGLDEDRYDLVVAKRPLGRGVGDRLWSEPMAWFGRDDTPHPVADPIDLVLIPAPSVSRDAILGALRAARRPWRAMFQCRSFATIEAALRAGVGISAFGRNLRAEGLVELGEDSGLPPLPDIDIVLERDAREGGEAVEAFCAVVREASLLSAGRREG